MNEENPYKAPEAEVVSLEDFDGQGLDSLDRMNRLYAQSARLQSVTYDMMFMTLVLTVLGAVCFVTVPLISWLALLGGVTTYCLYTRKQWAKALAYVFAGVLIFFPFGIFLSVMLILRLRKVNSLLLGCDFPTHRQLKLRLEEKRKETCQYLRDTHKVGEKWDKDKWLKK